MPPPAVTGKSVHTLRQRFYLGWGRPSPTTWWSHLGLVTPGWPWFQANKWVSDTCWRTGPVLGSFFLLCPVATPLGQTGVRTRPSYLLCGPGTMAGNRSCPESPPSGPGLPVWVGANPELCELTRAGVDEKAAWASSPILFHSVRSRGTFLHRAQLPS